MAKHHYVFLLAALSLPVSAQAGFEWRGPVAPPAAAAPAVDPDLPPPVTMWDGTTDIAPHPMPAQRVGGVDNAPLPPPLPSPAVPAAPSFPAPAASGDVIAGFGNDMPLAIALQQVVPPGYQFSFGPGADAGMNVSWQGGRAWQDVLRDMLAPAGLSYRAEGQVIHIGAQMAGGYHRVAPANDAAANSAPVEIRREKPSRLIDKIRAQMPSFAAPEEQQAAAPVPVPAPVPAPAPAPVPLAAELPPVFNEDIRWEEQPAAPVPLVAAELPPPMPAPMPAPMSVPVPVYEVAPVPVAPAAHVSPAAPQVAGEIAEASWHGAQGQTLRDVLKGWSDIAGVELYWSIDYDYRLTQDVAFGGSYDEAVGRLLDSFTRARPQPYGQLHQVAGLDGRRTLVIKSYDLAP